MLETHLLSVVTLGPAAAAILMGLVPARKGPLVRWLSFFVSLAVFFISIHTPEWNLLWIESGVVRTDQIFAINMKDTACIRVYSDPESCPGIILSVFSHP